MVKVKQSEQSIAVYKHASPLRELACHMGSRSVTCGMSTFHRQHCIGYDLKENL